MNINGIGGDLAVPAGVSPAGIRQGYSGEVSVGDRHARYQEAVLRGSVYSVTFAAAALAAASATAAGAFVLLNPLGSGKLLSLIDIQSTMTANTPVATGTAAVLGALINAIFSAEGTAVVPTPNLVGAANKSVAIALPSGTYAVLPSVTPPGLRQISGWYADLAASSQLAWNRDEVAGEVIIQPGSGVNVYGLGGTPADVTLAITMTWEEVSTLS